MQVTVPPVSPHEPVSAVADTKVTPPGRTSVTTTPVAVVGPWFVTRMVKVICSSSRTTSGATDFVTSRSDRASTGVGVEAVLFEPAWSHCAPFTVATLFALPGAVGRTVSVRTVVAPEARSPIAQVTGDPGAQPGEDWSAMRATFAGSVSRTTTPVARSGPLLVTVSV